MTDPTGLVGRASAGPGGKSQVLGCGGDAHSALDVGGLLNPFADGINGLIYICEGDLGGAAISGLSIFPIADLLKVLRRAFNKAARGGETAATRAGREAHMVWDPGVGFQKEFTLPSGRRLDAVNFETRQVPELKPNNPRAIQLGNRQLKQYVDELNQEGDSTMTMVRGVADALTGLVQTATRLGNRRPHGSADARPAWDAWHAGDFTEARDHAAALVVAGRAVDEGRHLVALVACVLGEYDEAIATHQLIDPRYRRLAELDEPVLWAYVHRDDIAGALAFAERRGLGRRGAVTQRLRLALENPLDVEIEGVVDVQFTDDALTPLMPGFTARLNGRPTVARLDTGGSFIHMTAEAAEAYGVKAVVAEREFAALRWHTVRHGFADLELGPIHLRNTPVAVHEGVLPTGPIAEAFGIELGPIIGTNVLERFLATVDAPGQRLLLSRRGDTEARTAHLAHLGAMQLEAPFALWSDHLMIARGRVGGLTDANLFVDSGLVAFTAEQGQAALLASRGALSSWGLALPADGRFAELPGPLAIGPAARDGLTAYTIPDPTWRDFGDWGGIRVDALVSWGYLRHFSWTIDFDRRHYLFGDAPGQLA